MLRSRLIPFLVLPILSVFPFLTHSAESTDRVTPAFIAAIGDNLKYCRDWLDGNDFKSLDETAGGIHLIAAVLQHRGQDAQWTETVAAIDTATSDLQKAAANKDKDAAQQHIDHIAKLSEQLADVAPGQSREGSPKGSGNVRQMMSLLDGTHADAKAALTFDEVDTARRQAIILAELGRVLSNYRQDEAWKRWSGELVSAAEATANHPSDDAKAIRTQLRGVYEKCEQCHNRGR